MVSKELSRGLWGWWGFACYAVLTFDRQEAPGLDGALRAILAQPLGRFLLTAVTVGFAAAGLFAMLQSRYRCV